MTADSAQPRSAVLVFLVLQMFGMLVIGCGTKEPGGDAAGLGGSDHSVTESELSPSELFQQVLQCYRDAGHYRDQGEVTVQYRLQGIPQRETGQLITRWSGDGRLYLRCYQLELACIPGRLEARIHDAPSNHLDQQLLVQPLADKVTLVEMLADPTVGEMVVSGRVGIPLPLVFLLSSAEDREALVARELELLEDDAIDGVACHRLQVTTESGPVVLWIDKDAKLVLRQDLPAETFAADLLGDEEVSDLTVRVDFRSAELPSGQSDSSLELAPLDDPQPVSRFVMPPPPLATDLFGRRPGRFELIASDESVVTRDSLRDSITVLAWCRADETCRPILSRLEQWTNAHSDMEDLAVLAVFSDPAGISHQGIAEKLAEWKVDLATLRDEDALAAASCQVSVVPTLMVLDGEGNVQVFWPGAGAAELDLLGAMIERLRDGEDLAGLERENQVAREARYQQELGNAIRAAAATFEVVEETPPELFKIQLQWQTEELARPGNLQFVAQPEGLPHVLAVDNGTDVIAIDGEGQVSSSHPLGAEEREQFTMLRAAAAGGSLYQAVFTPGGQRLLLFDEEWNKVLAYPPDDQPHEGISQVLLTDLENDGELELYVGFWGVTGVQRVSLEGERQWGYRGVSNVLSLATTPRNEVGWQKLLVTDQQGRLLQLNQFGNADLPVDTGVIPIHHLYAGMSGPATTTVLCGISSSDTQQAVGLDSDLNIRWRFPLALGTFGSPVDMISAIQLPDSTVAAWLVAAANGEVHLVGHNGSYADRFAVGGRITGIASGQFDGKAIVVIATTDKIRCWTLAVAPQEE